MLNKPNGDDKVECHVRVESHLSSFANYRTGTEEGTRK